MASFTKGLAGRDQVVANERVSLVLSQFALFLPAINEHVPGQAVPVEPVHKNFWSTITLLCERNRWISTHLQPVHRNGLDHRNQCRVVSIVDLDDVGEVFRVQRLEDVGSCRKSLSRDLDGSGEGKLDRLLRFICAGWPSQGNTKSAQNHNCKIIPDFHYFHHTSLL